MLLFPHNWPRDARPRCSNDFIWENWCAKHDESENRNHWEISVPLGQAASDPTDWIAQYRDFDPGAAIPLRAPNQPFSSIQGYPKSGRSALAPLPNAQVAASSDKIGRSRFWHGERDRPRRGGSTMIPPTVCRRQIHR